MKGRQPSCTHAIINMYTGLAPQVVGMFLASREDSSEHRHDRHQCALDIANITRERVGCLYEKLEQLSWLYESTICSILKI